MGRFFFFFHSMMNHFHTFEYTEANQSFIDEHFIVLSQGMHMQLMFANVCRIAQRDKEVIYLQPM